MLIALFAAAFASGLHDGKLHWLDAGGKPAALAYVFDNGADEPAGGLARFVEGSKVGFVDGAARVVIPAQWDWADRFQGGLARVCRGCAAQRDGEHELVRGGEWGAVDPSGKLAVPLSGGPVLRCEAGKTAVELLRDGEARLSGERACTLSFPSLHHRPRAHRPLAELTAGTRGCGKELTEELSLMIDLTPAKAPPARLQWLRAEQVAPCTLAVWDEPYFKLLSR